MYEVGNNPKHSRSESLPPPLQRSYGVVAISQKHQNLKKIGDVYVMAADMAMVLKSLTNPMYRYIKSLILTTE